MGNCPNCSLEHSNKSLDPFCNEKRMWTTFIFSSFAVLFGGWIIIFIYDLLRKWCRNQSSTRNDLDNHFNWLTEIKEWINNIISGQTKMGKTFVSISKEDISSTDLFLQVTLIFFCSIASLILYCMDTKHNKYKFNFVRD